MEMCFETELLLQWLNGALSESKTAEICEHVEGCVDCQQQLAELTDDDSISPPANPSDWLAGSTYTSEPHFFSLRKQLGEKVKGLLQQQRGKLPNQSSDPDLDGMRNEFDDPTNLASNALDRDTVEGHADSTIVPDLPVDSDQDLNENIGIVGFRLERLIGKGGFAHVYQAWEPKLERTVAIKVLDSGRFSARDRHRFSREAKAASGVESPYVVRVLSSGETTDGRPYIAMELVKGSSLSSWINERVRQKQLDQSVIEHGVEFLIQAARGAQAVHDAGLIHRDIKPGNIFLAINNQRIDVHSKEDSLAKLGDFGLARFLNEDTVTLTRVAELAGTPAYMSPEQTQPNADVDSRADVYSLGATLYHCLTGQAPFRGSSLAVLKQVTDVEPLSPRQLNEHVSRDLEMICLKSLSKLPEHRYASAGDFADDLQRFIEGQPIMARPIPAWRRLNMWRRRNLALANALGLLLLALVLGTAGTTAMWINSSSNAEEARQYAASLEENRTRLRESVSRFQKRVFSQQAMHWQMPESLRAEMFADVISYLDEFAELETPENADFDQMDELTNDYLLVARTALDVNRFKEARIASSRALERLRKTSVDNNSQSSNQLLQFRAARLAYLAQTPTSKFFDLARTNKTRKLAERRELALECRESIHRATVQPSANPLRKLQELEANFLVIASTADLGEEDLVEARLLFDEIRELVKQETNHEIRLEFLETAIRVGWFLSEIFPNSISMDVIQTNIAMVETMRESLRRLNKSMIKSDWLKGNNYARLAVQNHADGDLDGAIENASLAQHAFRKAVELRPQNQFWAHDMICLQILLGDWLVEQGELTTATETLTGAVMNNIRLSKSYPDNFDLQKRTVKIFAKTAKVCEKRKMHEQARRDYYIAARDCQLIFLREEHRDWAFGNRLWFLSKALEQLELAPDKDIQSEMMKNENATIKNWRKQYGVDTSLMQAVIDGKHQPERPEYLEFERITEDILAGN